MRGVKTFKKGFTVLELLVAVMVSIIVLASIAGIYIISNRAFGVHRELSLLKESTKEGIYALEWFFQRWGVGVPCINPQNPALCAQVQQGTDPNVYPPPSALYIVRRQGNPCDEIVFYGSLGGMGFVDAIRGEDRVTVMSCRLAQNTRHNCYYIWRGARIFVNQDPGAGNLDMPLIFTISGLSQDNLDCINVNDRSNAVMNLQAVAQNGRLETFVGNNRVFTNILNLESGDLLIRVPHRIRIFCQPNPTDNNNIWLYAEATDMSPQCNSNEPAMPLVRVNAFRTQIVDNGLLVTLQVTEEGRTLTIQRFYGR